jgi:hypothetical protein
MSAPEIEACLSEIARAREDLERALQELKSGDSLPSLDWRVWFERHPLGCTAAALATGFLLSQPSRKEGRPTLLDDLGRAGIEAALPALLKFLV